jgi:hypothetical protein
VTTDALLGKHVIVRIGGHEMGAGVINMLSPGRFGTSLRFPTPNNYVSNEPVIVEVQGQTAVALSLPDYREERRQVQNSIQVHFQPFVFRGHNFPEASLQDGELISELLGDYTLRTTYYDKEFHRVSTAEAAGRYGAVVQVRFADGVELTRKLTLYHLPDTTNNNKSITTAINFPIEYGIPTQVCRKQRIRIIIRWAG